MQRDDITELHYITPISNLPSILEVGILSHHKAQFIRHLSVANEDVQSKRRWKPTLDGRNLHTYVNLYFNANNPMLYVLRHMHKDLAVLSIDPTVIDTPGVYITDGNAASTVTRFLTPDVDGFSVLSNEDIYSEYWTSSQMTQDEKDEASRRRCAEVLVPNHIHRSFIKRVYCSCKESMAAVESGGCTIEVKLNEQMFFQPQRRPSE